MCFQRLGFFYACGAGQARVCKRYFQGVVLVAVPVCLFGQGMPVDAAVVQPEGNNGVIPLKKPPGHD